MRAPGGKKSGTQRKRDVRGGGIGVEGTSVVECVSTGCVGASTYICRKELFKREPVIPGAE